ncbi:insulinase family protein, partial [Campylobacter lari]|nr:insulinase family protein [Campylobacter lari]
IKAEDVEKELLKILEDVKNAKFDDTIMEKIKNTVKSDFIFSLSNASSVANIYGSYLAKGDLKPLLDYEKNIENLSKDDLIHCARKYFNENKSTTIILKRGENG